MHVYTDASKCPETWKGSAAFCIPELKYSKKFRLSNNISVFKAELVVILLSLHFRVDTKPRQVLILSDSLSALTAISNFVRFKSSPIIC